VKLVFQLFFQNSRGRRFRVAFFGRFSFHFSSVFAAKIFELAVKMDEKQPKNSQKMLQ
jgi:hypothetical protein